MNRRRFLRFAGAAAFTTGALLVNPEGWLGTANAQSPYSVRAQGTAKAPVQAESYLIYTDGSTWYASNGVTGAIDYSNSDAATVIQGAINNLTSGIVVVRDAVKSLTSSITMKSHVQVKFLTSVLVVGDIDGFVFNGVNDSSLEAPLLSVWVPSTFTHAAIKLTGALCTKNSVNVNDIQLPVTGYGLQIVAGSGHSVYENKIDIQHIEKGQRGVRVQTSSTGWVNVNKLHFVSLSPSEYGFSLTQNGAAYSGNVHDFCWTEIEAASHISAFYYEGNAGEIHDNTFNSCKAVDLGAADSYFIKVGSLSGCTMSKNVYLGCQGSDYTSNTSAFANDIWADWGTGIQTYVKSNGSMLPAFAGTVLKPASAPQSPVEGQIYYDSSLHKLKVYNGSVWETVTS